MLVLCSNYVSTYTNSNTSDPGVRADEIEWVCDAFALSLARINTFVLNYKRSKIKEIVKIK